MTIHSEHPFLPAEPERDPVRRFRGRLAGGVTVWTAVARTGRPAGLTVTSVLVATGEPPMLVGLIDQDAELYAAARSSGRVAVSLLTWEHRQLADVLAGLTPAPGGPFRVGRWVHTDFGPVPDGAAGWAGVQLTPGEPGTAGWYRLLVGAIATVSIGPDGDDPLISLRGGYHRPA